MEWSGSGSGVGFGYFRKYRIFIMYVMLLTIRLDGRLWTRTSYFTLLAMMSRTAAAAALLNEQFWLDFGCERSAGLAFFNSPFMKKQPSTSTAALTRHSSCLLFRSLPCNKSIKKRCSVCIFGSRFSFYLYTEECLVPHPLQYFMKMHFKYGH
jgi:hypothetical protein